MSPRRSGYSEGWDYYESPGPRPADGIRAKSSRGNFTQTWWGDRWIKALKPLMDPGRLSRGRSYARSGQVLEIEIAPGKIAARVQGSRPQPYKVTIQLAPLSQSQWEKVLDELSEQAIFSAQLLNGEMPPEVEEVFETVKAPLFPTTQADLKSKCSCPDDANPCKHIAAVYYLIGERFDADPFLLFLLRGQTRDQITAGLRARRAATAPPPAPETPVPTPIPPAQTPPLAEQLDRFWKPGSDLESIVLHMAPPPVELALLKRAGQPAFISPHTFQQIETAARHITDQAMKIAFKDKEGKEEN